MIQVTDATKRFGDFTALDHITCNIPEACIYGMVGSNGAGKSTFLRLITGIYCGDTGKVLVDGKPVYNNPDIKQKIAFVPDELFFLPGASMKRMAKLYQSVYNRFDYGEFESLAKTFQLDIKKPINSFSKGMRRQAATILTVCCHPDYIFFDETFDGLDPIMRNLVKSVISRDVYERKTTAIITSHSLRELENTCDQLSLLHKGGIVFESDVQNLKTSLFKVQAAFSYEYDKELFQELQLVNFHKKGSVCNMIVRGDRQEVKEKLQAMEPSLIDILPLSLEEVFTYEMESLGYSFKEYLEQ